MSKKNSKYFNEQHYPGAAVDAANNDTATPKLERQYTRCLNNNPRNNDD